MKNIQEAINTLTKVAHENERFVIAGLVHRITRFAHSNSADTSAVMAASILGKMDAKGQTYITREALNRVYEDVYSPGTSLGTLLEMELGRGGLLKGAKVQKYYEAKEDFSTITDRLADPVIKNSLDSMWADGISTPYSKQVADDAVRACRASAEKITSVKDVVVLNGNDRFILCKASMQSARGIVEVVIPVEIVDSKALEPGAFLAGDTLKELNAEVLSEHILSGLEKEAEHQNFYDELPKVEIRTPETDAFAANYDAKYADAADCYGADTVNRTLELVAKKFQGFGYSVQAAVQGIDPGVLVVVASLNGKAGIRIPVKIVNQLPLDPEIVIASGEINSFTKDGVDEIVATANLDRGALAVASKYGSGSVHELIEIVREAAGEGNFIKAEDAMNSLAEHPEAYGAAMQIMIKAQSGKDAEADKLASAAADLPLDGFVTNRVILY